MSAEATNPGAPLRKRSRPRIDLRRLGRVALLGPVSRDRLPDAISHVRLLASTGVSLMGSSRRCLYRVNR